MDTIDAHAVLAQVPLFAGLTPAQLAEIADACQTVDIGVGAQVFGADKRPAALYQVLAGQVKLAISSDEGDEKVLEIYSPGECFGLAELFSTLPFRSYAEATLATRLLQIGRQSLLRAMAREPLLADRIMGELADRTASLERDIAAYCFHSGRRRVLDFLLRQAGPDQRELVLGMRKHLIAARLNLTPATLSRTLRDLAEAGLISVHGRRVTLEEALLARRAAAGSRQPPPVMNRRHSDAYSDRDPQAASLRGRGWV